jgi:antitoxin (DNA-binding transcriptional repressor) of toxin-antitoxin stability system
MALRMGLREANQQFSKAVKAIKAGTEVILTERGTAIAVIRPLRNSEDPEAVIERLRATGFLSAAASHKPLPPWKPRPVRGEPASRTLQKERNER